MDEAARRPPVWMALSELFLDTDVRYFYARIAEELARSTYPEAELRRILDDEVTPVLAANLLAPAGVWDGFDPHWLAERLARLVGKKRWLPNLANVNEHWTPLAILIAKLRAIDPDARARRTAAWNFLLPLTWGAVPGPGSGGIPMEELQRIFEEDIADLPVPGATDPRGNWKALSGA